MNELVKTVPDFGPGTEHEIPGTHSSILTGYAGKMFDNGYGISAIKGEKLHHDHDDKWEVAVRHGEKLCFMTPITQDVIAWLTVPEVEQYAEKIAALPAVDPEECPHQRYLLTFMTDEMRRVAQEGYDNDHGGFKSKWSLILKLLDLYQDETNYHVSANAGLSALQHFEKYAGYTPKRTYPTYEQLLGK
jgi:hypothetical protein